ncbi:MAG: hypothetical protein IKJ01_08240 [Lachnospiraceae bacterium]|nr:hypothetical protein [Lachnospiraceae bacterium]
MKKEKIYVALIGIVFFGLSIFTWIKPADDFSISERRQLAQFPTLNFETIQNGNFMEKFEIYTLDQFPFRETFRSLKAVVHKYIFAQSDNNNIYLADDSIAKMEYPYNANAIQRTVNKFNRVYEKYMSESDVNVYYALIPDKNYFLAEESGHLSMDYNALYNDMAEGLPQMQYIEIKDLLSIEDFYRTDTHWKQENILDVAKHLGESMGTPLFIESEEYETIKLNTPFYGVYYGQLGLPVEPDTLQYMDNPLFADCIIYDHENQKEIPMYDLTLAKGRDPYEMFLSGSLSVITIENPNATTEKELVIFRDSFGSSITPLLVEGYQKITMLDIRYLNETLIGNFVDFTNQDILFLHSTSVVNNISAF